MVAINTINLKLPWLWLPILIATYASISYAVVHLFSGPNNTSLVWPLSGVSLALVLLGGRKMLLVILISEFLGNLLSDLNWRLSSFLALSVTLEILCAHGLLTKKYHFDDRLHRVTDFIVLAQAAGISALLGGACATASLWLGNDHHSDLLPTFFHWWQGDVLGIILITPLILVWREWPKDWLVDHRIEKMSLLLILAFVVGQIVYLGWMSDALAHHVRAYWSFLFLVPAAVLFGRHGVLLVIILTALQSLSGISLGVGIFHNGNLQDAWFLLLILTIVGITLAINAEERVRRETELLVLQRNLKRLMQRREQVREDERQHIAREIHDELGQILTAIKMETSLLKNSTPGEATWRDDVKHLIELIDTCIKKVRNITLTLRPPVLQLGILQALQWLVDQFNHKNPIYCQLVLIGNDSIVCEPYVTTLFRVLQESLTNVSRHAHASRVLVVLSIDSRQISLMIHDDGRGFDVKDEVHNGNGMGLDGMKNRIESLDGDFSIRSGDRGTTLRCLLPLKPQGEPR